MKVRRFTATPRRADAPAFTDPLLEAGFVPLRSLWDGERAVYPSEQAARWALRRLQPTLAAAGALGLHRGRLYVHAEKFGEVLRDVAVKNAVERYGDKA